MNHPNIIRLVGVSLRPRPLLVLEYAEFGSLHKVSLESYSLRLKHSIAVQVASGLTYLHQHRIIYRDLKPDNILVFSPNISAAVCQICVACWTDCLCVVAYMTCTKFTHLINIFPHSMHVLSFYTSIRNMHTCKSHTCSLHNMHTC